MRSLPGLHGRHPIKDFLHIGIYPPITKDGKLIAELAPYREHELTD